MLLDPRNGPDWDLSPHAGDGRVFVVASVPRSGSTLLCNQLWDTGRVGAPKEYLNPPAVRDWERRLAPDLHTRLRHAPLRGPLVGLAGRGVWSDARLRAYLTRVRTHRTDPVSGWFGLKLHHHHRVQWFDDAGRDLDAFLAPTRWVRITRVDRVAQAVSWARALQTGQWASWQRPWLPPVYDRRAIATRLAAIDAAEAGWDTFFAARGITPVRVTHEALVADREATVRSVLYALDVPDADTCPVPLPDTRPQADATSAAWVARFRSEAR